MAATFCLFALGCGQLRDGSRASRAAAAPDGFAADSAVDTHRAGGGALNPAVAPGGNFDLSLWQLQEPIGAAGSVTTIGPDALAGANGFHDSYFFTDPSDGAMTFWDPENGVTTANSNHPRSELRELNRDGSDANWAVTGTNTLAATVAVPTVPDHVCVGQIHLGTGIEAGVTASTKPLCELYYYATGAIALGIENDPSGGQTQHPLATVAPGSKLTYVLQLTGAGTITVTINGAATSFTMPAGFAGYGQYFKAGDYDQTAGTDAKVGATVKFYALTVSHRP